MSNTDSNTLRQSKGYIESQKESMTPEERKDLCEMFFGMVEVVVDEFLSRERNRRWQNRAIREDMIGIGMVALRKASLKFDEDRGFQFNTYASNAIRYELIRFCQKLQRREEIEVPLDLVVDSDDEPRTDDDFVEADDYSGMIDGLAPTDPTENLIYYGLIIRGDNKAEVAEAAGVSIRKAGFIKKRIIKDIREKLGVTIK